MTRYPGLDQHCPITDRIDEAMDGSFCRQCKTTVHDLDALDEASRLRVVAGNLGPVCVRYRLPRAAALTAAARIAASLPAAAQNDAQSSAAAAQEATPPAEAVEDDFIVGVMSRPTRAERARYLREARRAERKAARERRRAEKAALRAQE